MELVTPLAKADCQMGKGTLKKRINQLFPGYRESEIVSILESGGKSKQKARDVKDMIALLELSQGDFSWLSSHSNEYNDSDLKKCHKWLAERDSYREGPVECLAFFSNACIPIAKVAIENECDFRSERGSLILQCKNDRYICIVPTMNQDAFVTEDMNAIESGKTRDFLQKHPGEFVALNNLETYLREHFRECP